METGRRDGSSEDPAELERVELRRHGIWYPGEESLVVRGKW